MSTKKGHASHEDQANVNVNHDKTIFKRTKHALAAASGWKPTANIIEKTLLRPSRNISRNTYRLIGRYLASNEVSENDQNTDRKDPSANDEKYVEDRNPIVEIIVLPVFWVVNKVLKPIFRLLQWYFNTSIKPTALKTHKRVYAKSKLWQFTYSNGQSIIAVAITSIVTYLALEALFAASSNQTPFMDRLFLGLLIIILVLKSVYQINAITGKSRRR